MAFLTWRQLDTGDTEEDFLIKLGEEIDCVWAWRVSDSEWKGHNARGYFSMTIDETLGNPDLDSDSEDEDD